MSSDRRFNVFSFCCLLATLWVILATSQLNSSKQNGFVTVQSDCVVPTLTKSVSVTSGKITTSGVSYTDFGFPVETIVGDSVVGTVDESERLCSLSYGGRGDDDIEWVYSCFDNGAFVCNILITD